MPIEGTQSNQHCGRNSTCYFILASLIPYGTDLILAADIPHSKANILVLHSLHIESFRHTAPHQFHNILHMYNQIQQQTSCKQKNCSLCRQSPNPEQHSAHSWAKIIGWHELPTVGMVVIISPSFSLYRMVVLPAASSPTCPKNRPNIKLNIHHHSAWAQPRSFASNNSINWAAELFDTNSIYYVMHLP